jgi:hypothetical protein
LHFRQYPIGVPSGVPSSVDNPFFSVETDYRGTPILLNPSSTGRDGLAVVAKIELSTTTNVLSKC